MSIERTVKISLFVFLIIVGVGFLGAKDAKADVFTLNTEHGSITFTVNLSKSTYDDLDEYVRAYASVSDVACGNWVNRMRMSGRIDAGDWSWILTPFTGNIGYYTQYFNAPGAPGVGSHHLYVYDDYNPYDYWQNVYTHDLPFSVISQHIYTLNVNSIGATGVDITGTNGMGGTTNYTKTSLSPDISTVLTAPQIVGATNFWYWGGCGGPGDSTDQVNRTCTVSVNTGINKTVTANYITSLPPTVNSSGTCSNTTQNEITSGGTTTFTGGRPVTAAGLVWNTTGNPTYAGGGKISGSTGQTINGWRYGGPWTSVMDGLTPDTTYHIRAYAANGVGTGYSNDEIICTTLPATNIPDLTAGPVFPSTVTAGVSRTYTSTISNIGGVSTGTSFSYFWQKATAPNGGGTVTDLPASSMGILTAGNSDTATSPSIAFASGSTPSVRVCADKTDRNSTGVITESDESEASNCSATWTNITVNPLASCANGANNPPTCNACPSPLVYSLISASCVLPLSISVSPTTYSTTLPNRDITATYTLTNGTSGNTTCKLLDSGGISVNLYTPCTGNMSLTAPAGTGSYTYFIQAFKSSTSETKTSNSFSVIVSSGGGGAGACSSPAIHYTCSNPPGDTGTNRVSSPSQWTWICPGTPDSPTCSERKSPIFTEPQK